LFGWAGAPGEGLVGRRNAPRRTMPVTAACGSGRTSGSLSAAAPRASNASDRARARGDRGSPSDQRPRARPRPRAVPRRPARKEIEVWWLQLVGGIIELLLGFWAEGAASLAPNLRIPVAARTMTFDCSVMVSPVATPRPVAPASIPPAFALLVPVRATRNSRFRIVRAERLGSSMPKFRECRRSRVGSRAWRGSSGGVT
jgi:hypothetical protein